jgi:hypothetical protein
MKILIRLTFGVLAMIAAASTASAEVYLTMQGGHVTLVAKNATIRQILAEWERVGQTKVVNGDRVPGGTLNLELTNVPEQQALDIVLRSVNGVLFAPRTALAAGNVSAFAQIVLMPPSSLPPPPANPTPQPPAFGQQPTFAQPTFAQPTYPQPGLAVPQQLPVSDDLDDRPNGVPQPRPVFVFPQPQMTNPQMGPANLPPGGGIAQPQSFPQPGVPSTAPPAVATPSATPGGVSVPGMLVPAPAPQQPGFPQQQLQPQNP